MPKRFPPRFVVVLLVGVICVGLFIALRRATERPANPASVNTAQVATQARGQFVPVSRARVGTIEGGVVRQISLDIGDSVVDQQEVARVRGGSGNTEIVTSPITGSVTDILIHVGDTVLPGTILATVGDMRRLQIETTDVDEYIVGKIRRGQQASIVVDAVGRQELRGVVRSISLVPRTTATGDEHYPAFIELDAVPAEVRAGMTAKITFLP